MHALLGLLPAFLACTTLCASHGCTCLAVGVLHDCVYTHDHVTAGGGSVVCVTLCTVTVEEGVPLRWPRRVVRRPVSLCALSVHVTVQCVSSEGYVCVCQLCSDCLWVGWTAQPQSVCYCWCELYTIA